MIRASVLKGGAMRLAPRLAVLPVLLVGTTGCFSFETLVRLKADGSGQLVQTVTMNPKAMEGMMEGMGKELGMKPASPGNAGEPSGSSNPLFTDSDAAKAKAKAAEYGEGVTFVSAEPIDKPEAKGMKMTFAFKDVTKLKISQKPEPPAGAPGPGAAAASPEDQLKFGFTRQPGRNAVLTVLMGDGRPSTAKKGATPASTPAPEPPPEAVEMMKKMFQGLRVALAVEVDGAVVKTNSPYVDGSRVTLMDIQFDSLLAEEGKLKKLDPNASFAETMRLLKGVKGIKLNPEPEVRIEFAGK
jgi:hypothetical protein